MKIVILGLLGVPEERTISFVTKSVVARLF